MASTSLVLREVIPILLAATSEATGITFFSIFWQTIYIVHPSRPFVNWLINF